MQSDTEPKTSEEPIQEDEELQKTLDETAERLRKARRSKTLWRLLAIVVVGIYVYQKRSNTVWLPVADSQQMCVVMSDWWGLRVQAYYPVWRKPTGENGEYSEQWCIKYPDNSWRGLYSGHGESRTYTRSPATDNTYF